jgi:hypothetical protein
MALAGARRTEEKDVLALGDEAGGGKLVDDRAIHLLVEIEIKGVERAFRVTEARELVPPLEQAVLSSTEFVGHERRHEIEGRRLLGLRLAEPRFQNGGHAREPQLPKRPIEFHQIHCASPVRSMRSR